MGKELENLISKKHLFIAYALTLSSYGVTEEKIFYCPGYSEQRTTQVYAETVALLSSETGEKTASVIFKDNYL